MSKLLLGLKSYCWKQALDSQEEYQINVLQDPQSLPDEGTIEKHLFLIFDQFFFDHLSPGHREELHRSKLLLILPEDLDPKIKKEYSHQCAGVFYSSNNESPTPAQQSNFLTFVSMMLGLKTLNRRLDNYIRDSFQDIVDTNLLQAQKLEIEKLNKQLEEISRADPLTNLLNRRALMESFELEKKRALRNRWRLNHSRLPLVDGPVPLPKQEAHDEQESQGSFTEHVGNFACILVDIDHFKLVNDNHGHLAGDQVLQGFAHLLQNEGIFRDNDIVGRFGGEEFIILLPETNGRNASIPAERLRTSFKAQEFVDEDGVGFRVTLSFGVSEFQPEEVSTREMINRADRALYWAKEHGRDQVCLFDPALFSQEPVLKFPKGGKDQEEIKEKQG